MKVLILQPPIVQLNTPYPSGAYLLSFFKSLGCDVEWIDLNLALFDEIFSKEGLTKLFELATPTAIKIAQKSSATGDKETAFNLNRYLSQKNLWIQWIEPIKSILKSDKNFFGFENAHRFVFGAHVPRGMRMLNYLNNLNHSLSTDDARSLASLALADLADFINVAFDSNFSLVRYAERLTSTQSTFSAIEKTISSPILKNFYEPLLFKLFDNKKIFDLVLISVPFAGTFTPALSTAKFFKNKFNTSKIILGGGFINTELRDCSQKSLVNYCDYLCYDRGYATYKTLLENFNSLNEHKPIYKLRQFFIDQNNNPQIVEPAYADKFCLNYEKQITQNLIPDFSTIDFSKYPRLIDDINPMHRLWSDGAWIKIYMAHGCYWHKCAFCDVTLDYVKGYCPVNIHNLYEKIFEQCKQKGIYGIHFVDEAMPPTLMIEFAKENIAHGSPLTWWGNIRFEKFFTRDVTDFLAYGGLIGVSAGLESATSNTLNTIHKGTDLKSIVASCCAFKESGILVHAYMIYGYWFETPQDLINSMETLRQFYLNGLLDSCFWHKFVLTQHSRVYDEFKKGLIKDLIPLKNSNNALFAKNTLAFKNEEFYTKFSQGLEISLNQWMHEKDLTIPVQKWFNFSVPKPTVSNNFIENLIQDYENEKNKQFALQLPKDKNKIFWLGGEKIPTSKNKITWTFMGETFEENADAPLASFRGKGLCVLP